MSVPADKVQEDRGKPADNWDRRQVVSNQSLYLKIETRGWNGWTDSWLLNICLSANLVVVTAKFKAKLSLLLLCDSFLKLTYEWTHLP